MTIQKYDNLYLFVLGRETKIALLELESVLRRFCFGFSISNVSGNLVFINIKNQKDFDYKGIIGSLGGTIKIFKIIGPVDKKEIIKKVSDSILNEKKDQTGKIKFGLSNFSDQISRKDIQDMGIKIKMGLKNDLSIRYIENREGGDLQPIISAKNKLDSKGVEFGIFNGVVARSEATKSSEGDPFGQSGTTCHPQLDRGSTNSSVDSRLDPKGPPRGGNDDKVLLGKLIAVYNPVSWSKRDYGKPKSDKYSGMMPPKLARMLVNITVGEMTNDKNQMSNKISNDKSPKFEIRNSDFDINDKVVIFDPFCGSGNILIEASELGYPVVGSDISEKAVNDSVENLGWLSDQLEAKKLPPQGRDLGKKTGKSNSYNLFVADATKEELIEKLMVYLPKKLPPQGRDLGKKTGKPNAYNLIVVAEPYLGKPKKNKPKTEDLKDEITELKKMYLAFLGNLSLIHNSLFNIRGIALVFPLFELENGEKLSLFDEAVDEIAELGYTPIRTLKYGRDYQVIKRKIAILKFK